MYSDDAPEALPPMIQPRKERYIDARTDTNIVVSQERLLLHIRELEHSKKVPSIRQGLSELAAGIISAGTVLSEIVFSPDEYSIVVVVIFTVLAGAGGFAGVTDLIETFKDKKKRNMTADDVVRKIADSS